MRCGEDGDRVMLDGKSALLEALRLGESSVLEYKEVRFSGKRVTAPGRDALADALAAFANARGGVFVLGVEDKTHQVLGVPVERFGFGDRARPQSLHGLDQAPP